MKAEILLRVVSDSGSAGPTGDFPPDKDETAVTEEQEEPELPVSSPVGRRQYSETSEESLASRHHSYETLNMSEIITSIPHRPAPKPPGKEVLAGKWFILQLNRIWKVS